MMSVKKNLTIATLATLLTVPAFGATNASNILHMPSVTAHADESSNVSNPSWWYETGTRANVVLNRSLVAKNVYQNPKGDYLNKVTGTTTFPIGDHVHVVSQGTNGVDLAISDHVHPITNNSSIIYSIPSSDATAFRNHSLRSPRMNNTPYTSQHTGTLTHSVTFDGHTWPAGTAVYGAQTLGNPNHMYVYLGNDTIHQRLIPDSYYKSLGSTSNSTHTANQTNQNNLSTDRKLLNNRNDLGASTKSKSVASNNNVINSNNDANNATQYASKKSLPQTGESNDTSKAMELGAVALGASASMMALSFAKKHQQEAKMVMPVEPAVNNDGGSHKEDNVDKSTYHMIMSNTFKSINNDLKKF